MFRCACAVGFFLLNVLFTSISFHKKALSTLNIYTIVIRLKSQVLRKEDSRLVADRQADMQSVFIIFLKLKALGTLDRRAHHLSYQGGPKITTTYFLCVDQFGYF